MSTQSLHQKISAWLQDFSYWYQYAGNKFLRGEPITPELIDTTYQLFLEDEELVEKSIQREEITTFNEALASGASNDLLFVEVKGITNVNALSAGQVISLHKQLTVVYGGNGTGKSGYIRMMNNAFKGRGDKEMLQNIFAEKNHAPQSCTFSFADGGTSFDLKFPDDKASDVFSRFSVFDSECIKVQLEQENSLLFTPTGFEFFNQSIMLFEALKNKLQKDLDDRKKINEFSSLFSNDTLIQQHIAGLGANTNIDALTQLASYTEQDSQRAEELNGARSALSALNIPQQILESQSLQTQLANFQQELQVWLNVFSQKEIDDLSHNITSLNDYDARSIQEGIASLDGYGIEQLGTKQWKDFIVAAQQYALQVQQSRNTEENYPQTDDQCLFCLQPLAEKQRKLMTTYWSFVYSEAEKQAKRIESELVHQQKVISGLKLPVFDNTTNLYKYIEDSHPQIAITWKEIVQSLDANRQQLLTNLRTKKYEQPVKIIKNKLDEFLPVTEKLRKTIEELSVKNPVAEVATIDSELQLLHDKNLLSKLLTQVVAFVSDYQWAAKAEKGIGAFRTNAITAKQGELFALHITEAYTRMFNAECEKLKAPGFVNITQRNAKGQTLRKLQVANHFASKILSEGERRAITLADFLTEVQLNPHNKGIIFDDPVTSLDHERREIIAKRLVKEAMSRQVIVFTHDISFLFQLQFFADSIDGVSYSITSIRKQGEHVGIVHPTLPWVAQKVKDRIGYLRNAIVKLKKIEKEGTEDEYTEAAKSWYGLLREAWERAVEERLFKGVVERFAPGIQTNKLKKILITQQMLDNIERGMTESSKWVHDSAAGLNPPTPDTSHAEKDLQFFDDFTKGCVAA